MGWVYFKLLDNFDNISQINYNVCTICSLNPTTLIEKMVKLNIYYKTVLGYSDNANELLLYNFLKS